jgi:4-amino-4-deoxy-L-arabinose transferase-like glycosyltransferase
MPTTASSVRPGTAPLAARFAPLALPALLWAVLLAASLALRPLIPPDETRYASVAWEMWRGGDLLVPHMNGLPYSDKPPLLFWCIQLAWGALGVHGWVARLVPALFGLASLALVAGVARELWPQRPEVARRAPLVLVGLVLWAGLTGALMFDLLLAFFVTAGVWALLVARRRPLAGWALFAIAVGLGVLTKGPVALVPTLAVALAAPWWAPSPPAGGWRGWWGGLAAATLAGAALALAWALPAAAAGGPAYADALLVEQTRGRVVHAFAHGRPWWWYLPLVPVALYPFSFWPPLWRAAAGWCGRPAELGLRLAAAWTAVPFAVLSAISGKQVHYLLPLFPAVALAASRLLDDAPPARRRDLAAVAALPAALAVGVAALPGLAGRVRLPAWLALVRSGWGVALAALLAAAIVFGAGRLLRRRPERLAVAGAALVVVAAVCLHGAFAAACDVAPVAARLRALRAAGTPIAYAGDYSAELNFVGRLATPIEVVPLRGAADWLARHPDGRVAGKRAATPLPGRAVAESVQPYLGDSLAVWKAPPATVESRDSPPSP